MSRTFEVRRLPGTQLAAVVESDTMLWQTGPIGSALAEEYALLLNSWLGVKPRLPQAEVRLLAKRPKGPRDDPARLEHAIDWIVEPDLREPRMVRDDLIAFDFALTR